MDKIEVGTSQFIRDLNLIGIFKLIHKYGPISRKELAENTGYSAATISNHVKRLLKKKFVIETRKGSSTGGRKPVYLSVKPGRGYFLAVDIEVSRVKIRLFNLMLNISGSTELAISDNQPREVFRYIMDEIYNLLKNNNIGYQKIMGMGIAVPGLVDINKGILEFAPNLGWKQINIVDFFQKEFSFPVIIENEANAAVIGERVFKYPEIDNQVFVSINQGIGCGIVFNGTLYKGASGNAGEFGHIIIDSDGPPCHCGNHGCWETLASLNYINNRCYEKTGSFLDMDYLKEEADKGDKDVLSLVKETGKNIGVGLANIINSLSPELLIIGGDISYIKEYITEEITSVLRKEALEISYQRVRVVYSQLGNQAALYGLASMVFDNIIEQEFKEKV